MERLSFGNDPSAGSPTETLLRLLLPLNDQVCPTSRQKPTVANQFPTLAAREGCKYRSQDLTKPFNR